MWHYIYSQHNVVLNYINWREIKKAIKKEKTRGGKKETYVLNISAVLSLIMPSNNNAARKPDQKKLSHQKFIIEKERRV